MSENGEGEEPAETFSREALAADARKLVAAQETIDLAVQCCGGAGIGRDLPLADFYEAVRAFRIIDGADEVHKRTIARAAFEDTDPAEIAAIPRFGG